MDTKYSVLAQDDSLNVLQEGTEVTTRYMTSRIGMWGESEFGEVLILGEGNSSTYITDDDFLNILEITGELNTIYTPVTLYFYIMSTPAGQWGSSMFGSASMLGTGSLIVQSE